MKGEGKGRVGVRARKRKRETAVEIPCVAAASERLLEERVPGGGASLEQRVVLRLPLQAREEGRMHRCEADARIVVEGHDPNVQGFQGVRGALRQGPKPLRRYERGHFVGGNVHLASLSSHHLSLEGVNDSR